jgi:hypothetical protein
MTSAVDIYKGLSFEAEIGYIGILELSGLGSGCFSINALYSFSIDTNARIDPFITVGHSWFLGNRANDVNFGEGDPLLVW